MALSNQLTNSSPSFISEDLFEKVILGQDLSGLNPIEKVAYIGHLCKTLGLNPYTKPFEIMKFNGKEVPYARKDCTEQLRKIHNVSITKLDTKIVEGGIYIVTAYAIRDGNVQDCATGVICISGLKGEALSNAMMKAETKAKRRVTLSICGLGMLDESEIDSLPNVSKLPVNQVIKKEHTYQVNSTPNDIPVAAREDAHDIDQDIMDIAWAENSNSLQEIYTKAYKFWANAKHKENLEKVISAKDKRKSELEATIETINPETGEIK